MFELDERLHHVFVGVGLAVALAAAPGCDETVQGARPASG
jgi:hypothetical protein